MLNSLQTPHHSESSHFHSQPNLPPSPWTTHLLQPCTTVTYRRQQPTSLPRSPRCLQIKHRKPPPSIVLLRSVLLPPLPHRPNVDDPQKPTHAPSTTHYITNMRAMYSSLLKQLFRQISQPDSNNLVAASPRNLDVLFKTQVSSLLRISRLSFHIGSALRLW